MMMMGSLQLTGNHAFCSSLHSSNSRPATTPFKLALQSTEDGSLTDLVSNGRNRLAFRVMVSSGKGFAKEVIMVDPSEAKRLAVKQMQEIQARDKLNRQRQIESINGAWAMIGLTAGLVIEGQTGNSIPMQLYGYWNTIISQFSNQEIVSFEQMGGHWTEQVGGYWNTIVIQIPKQ